MYLKASILIAATLLVGNLDRIKKAFEKAEYEKVEELIQKGLEKEPENPGIHYYRAYLYADRAYQQMDLDSARKAIAVAKDLFPLVEEKLKEDLLDDGITQESIEQLSSSIRDRLYLQLSNNLSLSNIAIFNAKYPNSIYAEVLDFKIDSIDFQQAKVENSESAYLRYISNHNTSIYKPTADSLLDAVRFKALKQNGKEADYEKFLRKYPLSNNRMEVEQYLYRIQTADHKEESYLAFLAYANTEALRKQAIQNLFYLTDKLPQLSKQLSDSLAKAAAINDYLLFPAMQDGLFGFYNSQGVELISPQYSAIQEQYKCQVPKDDWLLVFDQSQGYLINKAGQRILGEVADYRNLSSGVGLVKQGQTWHIYHKSGRIILADVEDAAVVAGQWIKIKRAGKWGLISYTGETLLENRYNDLYKIGNFWIVEKDGALAITNEATLLAAIEEDDPELSFTYEDVELVSPDLLLAFAGDSECMFDANLKALVPCGNYQIYPEESGYYLKTATGYKLYNDANQSVYNFEYPYVTSNSGWLTMQTDKDWILLPKNTSQLPSREYDSVKLINDYAALTFKEDGQRLLFTSGRSITTSAEAIVTTAKRRSDITIISDQDNFTFYDSTGLSWLTGDYEKASFLNDTILAVSQEGKQGVVHINGDELLPFEYESLDEANGMILVLKDGKIGAFDLSNRRLIPAEYEARIEKFGSNYLAKSNGKLGILDSLGEQLTSFNYEEITFWNDTSIWIVEEEKNYLINFKEEKLTDPIDYLEQVHTSDENTYYTFIQDGKYGLLSTQDGRLLSAVYSEIRVMAALDRLVFFADQHLPKAGFHVVSYVDEKGELILSKAYRTSTFTNIFCDD